MIIIIDAYNILKQISKTIQVTDAERSSFIALVKKYASIKKLSLILVFDGGSSVWTTEHTHCYVTVIYAGAGQSADHYIEKYIDLHHKKEIILVSSDNQLSIYAQTYGVPSMHSIDFYTFIQNSIAQHHLNATSASTQIIKTSTSNNKELDEVMNSGTKKIPLKDTIAHSNNDLHYTKSTLTKQERILLKKLKKL